MFYFLTASVITGVFLLLMAYKCRYERKALNIAALAVIGLSAIGIFIFVADTPTGKLTVVMGFGILWVGNFMEMMKAARNREVPVSRF